MGGSISVETQPVEPNRPNRSAGRKAYVAVRLDNARPPEGLVRRLLFRYARRHPQRPSECLAEASVGGDVETMGDETLEGPAEATAGIGKTSPVSRTADTRRSDN